MISRNLEFIHSPSSEPTDLMITALEYIRRTTKRVAAQVNGILIAVTCDEILGGLTKFGVTPSGGGKESMVSMLKLENNFEFMDGNQRREKIEEKYKIKKCRTILSCQLFLA